MIDWKAAQRRLGVVVDGQAGPLTYGALMTATAGLTSPLVPALARSLAAHTDAYGLTGSARRLAAFLGQSSVESGGFRLLRETWGPTAAQRAYDQPGNTLGNRPGDAYAMRGAGLIEVTGRANLTRIGRSLGIPLADNPDLANDPDVAVRISLEWWSNNAGNRVADTRDTLAVSRLVNRGSADSTRTPLALGERIEATGRATRVLSG